MMAMTSPGSTRSVTPFRTSLSPNFLRTSSRAMRGMQLPFQPEAKARQGPAQREVDQRGAGIDGEGTERGVGDHRAGLGQLGEPDDGGQRGALDDLPREADGGRNVHAQRLRYHPVATLLPDAPPQTAGTIPLPLRTD